MDATYLGKSYIVPDAICTAVCDAVHVVSLYGFVLPNCTFLI